MAFDKTNPSSIMDITISDITKSFIFENFSVQRINGKDSEPIKPSTKFKLDANRGLFKHFKNAKALDGQETTVGRFIENIFFLSIPLEEENYEGELLSSMIDYTNVPFKAGVMKGIGNQVGLLLLEQKIDTHVVREYIDRTQWLGNILAIFTIPSLDNKTFHMDKAIKTYRDKVLKENKEAIERKDLVTFNKIEKDILSFAAKHLKEQGATGQMIYDSGYNGDWGNNFKNTSIFRGIVAASDDPTNVSISLSNLTDGVAKEDLVAHADIAVAGAAGRAVDTRKGGYLTKIFNAAYSSVVAGEPGSDCGTKGYITVTLTPKNIGSYRFRYIIDDKNGLVLLTSELFPEYVGKTVKMRSPIHCRDVQICSKCLGKQFELLKTKNIGLHISRQSSQIMNFSMKSEYAPAVQ